MLVGDRNGCYAFYNLENIETNDQTCGLDSLTIIVDGLLQAGSCILKLSISSEKCFYDLPYVSCEMRSEGNITDHSEPNFVMLDLSCKIQHTSRADIRRAICKTSTNVFSDILRNRFHDLEMTELLADIFQSL